MLVIQHMKGCFPYDASVLNFPKQAGETLLRVDSRGVILAEEGAFCPMQVVPPCFSFVHP
jgi:hypothetical protein